MHVHVPTYYTLAIHFALYINFRISHIVLRLSHCREKTTFTSPNYSQVKPLQRAISPVIQFKNGHTVRCPFSKFPGGIGMHQQNNNRKWECDPGRDLSKTCSDDGICALAHGDLVKIWAWK